MFSTSTTVQLYGFLCLGMLDMTSRRLHTFRVGDGDRYDEPPASLSPTFGSGSILSGCLLLASADVFRLGLSRAAAVSDGWLIFRGFAAACFRSMCSMSAVLDRNTAPPMFVMLEHSFADSCGEHKHTHTL